MSIGLERGIVRLSAHDKSWEKSAKNTITLLKEILGKDAVDIEHVGSTAIRGILAKPIIDLVVGVSDFANMEKHDNELQKKDIRNHGPEHDGQLLYVAGDFENNTRTHHIHVVIYDGNEWNNYINFRDYMNAHENEAKAYSRLKELLAQKYATDRNAYTARKAGFITNILKKAAQWKMYGEELRNPEGKELSEMNLEELWTLFPIILAEPNKEWKIWYQEEADELRRILHEITIVNLQHIGSTAIHGIWAKPTVDILIEVPSQKDFDLAYEQLIGKGYMCMSRNERRVAFNKGYTKKGFAKRVFHIHLRFEGDNDEISFRDAMNKDPQKAREYELLKLSLRGKYEHDRDAYTEAKTDFVKGER